MKRQQPCRAVRPRGEGLEDRIALSSDVGVNLNFNDPSVGKVGSPIWVDVHNLATGWGLPGDAWDPDPAIPLTPDNYPLIDAWAAVDLANYPDGDYQLSYTGSATVTFAGVGRLAGPVTTGADGVTTGTVVVDHALEVGGLGNHQNLIIEVSRVDTADPLDHFHLYAPGYGNNPTQVYTNAFLHQLQPFSTIRFVDWTGTIGSTETTWQTRTPPGSFLVTGARHPVPWEDIIELANEAYKDMWINIPALATPDYIQNLAQLIAAKLDPNLHVYVEYSNENWNAIWPEYGQVLQAAEANPMVDQGLGPLGKIAQQSAYEMVLIAQAFDRAFGARGAQVRPIMAGWSAMPSYAQTALQFIQQHDGAPSRYIWGIAVDSYVGLPGGVASSQTTLDQVFAGLNQYLTNTLAPRLQANEALARSYGLSLVAYEGGQALPEYHILSSTLKLRAQADPRMYQLYIRMMNTWDQITGGGLFNHYTLTDSYGYWGLLNNVLSPGSQEWNAMMSRILPPGDADLDGSVDYDDLQTLLTNYGRPNAYWEQGDFNDDGVVNWADLNLLRSHLDPAGFTLAQFAQAALAGQPGLVTAGQTMEYDGYGVAYASDLPFASSSNGAGPVRRDATSSGKKIVVDGLIYSKGLGVVANSSVTIALNGQYSRFESIIGVDGRGPSPSAVIFRVYGDGRLLYQSPTVTFASRGIPIDVGVAGVKTLSLVVAPGPGTASADDHAVWADARLVSTANFGTSAPYSLTWQLSQDGKVLTTQTTDSFIFGAKSGTYTLTVAVTDAHGDTATASTEVTVAALIKRDTTTRGNWIGAYGAQGYDIVGDAQSLPRYAAITPAGQSNGVWASSTTDPRALQDAGGSGRITARWYSPTSFAVDVNLADGRAHDLALYAVDWDKLGRSERIQLIDAATGVVLNTVTLSSFSGGVYLQWRVRGHVKIKLTRLAGPNAVLSGLFLDPAQ